MSKGEVTPSIGMPEALRDEVDMNYLLAGCRSRSDFFREAAKEKLERMKNSA